MPYKDKELLAYLAGYFDGEGCISIHYSVPNHGYKVLCNVGSTVSKAFICSI